MEVDEIQSSQPPCKYSRVNSNGRVDLSKITGGGVGSGGHNNGQGDEEVEETDIGRVVVVPASTTTSNTSAAVVVTGNNNSGGVGGDMMVGSSSRFGRQWHSSRIIRVSRASGGKDRHSKVWTAKGPRDRRVRLSVTTAIQFYDLQDRLGYDQPSKAVEWLIKAAADAINELPSLNTSNFPPETPRQLSDERKPGLNVVDSADADMDGDADYGQNQQQQKSGCSNNSETSKGSGLSLCRSEIRVKARERARERTAKDKERDGEPPRVSVASHQQHPQHQQQNVSSMPQTSSFTQLLTAGMNNLNESTAAACSSPSPHHHVDAEVGLFHKHSRAGNSSNQWLSSAASTTPIADYFGTGLMGLSSSRTGQIQLGNNPSSLPQVMTIASFCGSENQHQSQSQHDQLHHHHQHFPFFAEQHLIQVANAAASSGASGGSGNDYNLNFSISSSSTPTSSLAAGFNNRGTLQSNSQSLLPYLQRFSTPDGSSLPFFLSNATVTTASPSAIENHHHHQQFQSPGLQLYYGDGNRQSDQKGKGKN